MQSNKSWYLFVNDWANAADFTGYILNAGQKPFKFSPPDGFQPINAANVRPETVIARPDQFITAKFYSGENNTRSINIGMKPDFVWFKSRNQSYDHELYDSVRGATKRIYSNTNDQEATFANGLTSFDYNGFSVGNRTNLNGSSSNMVVWGWKAGGNKGTFNVDGEGYANASDVNMSVGSIRSAVAVSSGNDYSAGYAGHSPVGTWVDSDSWSGLPAYSSGQKGYFSGTETLSNGSVISAAANPKPFNAVANGSQGFVLRASTTVTLRLLVQGNTTEIATTSSDSQTFGNRTIVATNPTSGTYVEATGKCFWWSGNSNYPSISIMGTFYDAPQQPTIAASGCSVGTKQGFSIIKYTGSGSNGTIAHGLSQAPDFFFGRDLEDTGGSRDWIVYHKTMGNTGRLKFAGHASISESSTFFQDTSPTNSVITVGTSNDINSTNDHVLYCFHNVPGLQKFGGYTGNGSDDGPFVETGFRPALIWTRAYSSNSNNNSSWLIYDTLINPHNESSEVLYINLTNGVNSHASMGIDILSNGFKLKADTAGYSNYNGWSYVYCAWAEAPAFNLYGGQSNAR
jgi:hypothetical protein